MRKEQHQDPEILKSKPSVKSFPNQQMDNNVSYQQDRIVSSEPKSPSLKIAEGPNEGSHHHNSKGNEKIRPSKLAELAKAVNNKDENNQQLEFVEIPIQVKEKQQPRQAQDSSSLRNQPQGPPLNEVRNQPAPPKINQSQQHQEDPLFERYLHEMTQDYEVKHKGIELQASLLNPQFLSMLNRKERNRGRKHD